MTSQVSDGLFQAALAGSLLFNPQSATSALAVAMGFAVLLLPYSVIGPYVGVFLDRWSRRTVIYTASLIRAALVIPTALLIWYGQESAPYALCALVIIGTNRFFLAGLSASQPHVVPERRLVTANALATTLGTVIYSLGLGIAAVLLTQVLHKTFHGYAVLAGSSALGYAGAGLIGRYSFAREDLGPDDTERGSDSVWGGIVAVAKGMVAGLRHLGNRPVAGYLLVAQGAYRLLYGVLTLATLLLYRGYFYAGDSSRSLFGLGEVVVAGGVGSLLAAFITPPVTRAFGGRRYVVTLFAGAGVVIFGLGLPFRPMLLVAAVFFVNIASQGTKIVVDTALQKQCDDDFRGRVFSVNDTTYNLCFVAGLFIASSTLPANGHSVPAIVLVAAGYLALSVWYGLASVRAKDGSAATATIV
jgi:MFS family permease